MKDCLNGISYLVLRGDEDTEIKDISCDSRRIEPGFTFVCLNGSDFDGHDYVKDALMKGAAAIVVSRRDSGMLDYLEQSEAYRNVAVILTADTWSAYAVMAANFFHRPADSMVMIGITGTKGKTTVCYMISEILREAGFVPGMIGTTGAFWKGKEQTLKNTTPDAYVLHHLLSQMKAEGCTHVVMEVSSQGLKQHRTDTISFACTIFTNISNDHIGKNEHRDFDEYLYWKSRLFCQCMGTCIVNRDDRHTQNLLSLSDAGKRCHILYYGTEQKEDIKNPEERVGLYGSNIAYRLSGDGAPGMGYQLGWCCREQISPSHEEILEGSQDIFVHMPGLFHVYNSMAAAGCGLILGCSRQDISRGIWNTRVRGRTEVVYHDGNVTVMIDYAHNAVSAEQVLRTIRACHKGRIVCVFGCGGGRSRLRRFSMGEICGQYADFSVITEDNSRFEDVSRIMEDIVIGMEKSGGEYICIPDRRQAIIFALDFARKGDFIILLGKGHEDYMDTRGERVHFSEHEIVQSYCQKKRPGGYDESYYD